MPAPAEESLSTTPDDLADLVRTRLADLADPQRAPGMAAYMKSSMPYRGVTAAPLRALCREIFAQHVLVDEEAWRSAVLLIWDGATFREERYAAVALARARRYAEHQQPHTLGLYRHLVVSGAWWDHVDEVAGHLVRDLLVRHPVAVTPVLREWAGDDDLWLRRASIICQLGRGRETDLDLLQHAIDANLDGSDRTTPAESAYGREFFVRKAIGWALRDLARTDPDWVRGYIAQRGDRLSGLSRREALKHLCGRVSPARPGAPAPSGAARRSR